MNVYELIKKKRNGHQLSSDELTFMVNGFVEGNIPECQMAAFLMAVYFRGMNPRECVDLTMSMVHSGDIVDLSDIKGFKVDKRLNKKGIPEDEYAGIYWLLKLLSDPADEDEKDFVKIGNNKIELFFTEYFPRNLPRLLMHASLPEERVFKDAQVEFFYQKMKEYFLNYYKVFEIMGIIKSKNAFCPPLLIR